MGNRKRSRNTTFCGEDQSLPRQKIVKSEPRNVTKRRREDPELAQLREMNAKLRNQIEELTRQNTVFRNAIPRFHSRYQQKEREVQELATNLRQTQQQLAVAKQHVHQLEQANYALRA